LSDVLLIVLKTAVLESHRGGSAGIDVQGFLSQLLSTRDSVSRLRGNDPNTEDGEPGNQDSEHDDDDDDDDDDEPDYGYWGRPPARTPKWFAPVTAPQEAGLKLLMGGEFGRIGVEARSRKGSANFSKAILSRRSKLRQTPKQDITNVRAVYALEICLSRECRTLSRMPMVQLSHR
jgi:WD repeat-containing protein 23